MAAWDGGAMADTYCSDAGWCDLVSDREYGTDSIWGSDASNLYSVDSNGTLRHFDGTAWTATAGNQSLYNQIASPIGGSGPNDIWANSTLRYDTGGNSVGVMLHWNGTDWIPVVLGPNINLSSSLRNGSIWASGPNDVYMVAGQTIHWDGCQWSPVPVAGPYSGQAVWGSSSTDVWVAGTTGFQVNTQVAHFDGNAWTTQDTGVSTDIMAIWGSGPHDIFAVGDDNTYSTVGTILHYDGNGWSQMTVPAPTGWIAPNPPTLNAIWGSGPSDVWAFGTTQLGLAEMCIILHYDGHSWTLRNDMPEYIVGSATASYAVDAVWGLASNNIWAVGGNGQILHYDGNAWTYWSDGIDGAYTIHSIWGTDSRNDVWAVETNSYYSVRVNHWDGNAWAPTVTFAPDPVTTYPTYIGNGLSGSSTTDVWLVGTSVNEVNNMQVGNAWLMHFDGGSWADETSQVPGVIPFGTSFKSPQLLGVSAKSATDAWAVGAAALTLQWNGAAWSSQPNPLFDPTGNNVGPNLNAVIDFGNDAFAAGSKVTIGGVDVSSMMHYAFGNGWSLESLPNDQYGNAPTIYAIWGTGPTDVWAVGTSVYHRDASSWTIVSTPPTLQFDGVWGTSSTDVWFANGEQSMGHWDGHSITMFAASALGHNLTMDALWGDANGYWAAGGDSYYHLVP
jgi:hypothetical protein